MKRRPSSSSNKEILVQHAHTLHLQCLPSGSGLIAREQLALVFAMALVMLVIMYGNFGGLVTFLVTKFFSVNKILTSSYFVVHPETVVIAVEKLTRPKYYNSIQSMQILFVTVLCCSL